MEKVIRAEAAYDKYGDADRMCEIEPIEKHDTVRMVGDPEIPHGILRLKADLYTPWKQIFSFWLQKTRAYGGEFCELDTIMRKRFSVIFTD